MIVEDYCSYEIAKLLKEKGFDEQTVRCYNLKKELCRCQCEPGETINSTPNYLIAAPTLQMAMKWLREVHNIFIQLELYSKYNDYWFELFQNTHRLMVEKREVYNSYEDACEAAIKYCLENLL